jgi:hypothetical protein
LSKSIMEAWSKSPTKELDAVRYVKEKVEIMLKVVELAKEKVELFKCIKWDPACINKFKRLVMLAKEKGRLSPKEPNAKDALARKF